MRLQDLWKRDSDIQILKDNKALTKLAYLISLKMPFGYNKCALLQIENTIKQKEITCSPITIIKFQYHFSVFSSEYLSRLSHRYISCPAFIHLMPQLQHFPCYYSLYVNTFLWWQNLFLLVIEYSINCISFLISISCIQAEGTEALTVSVFRGGWMSLFLPRVVAPAS